MDTERNEDLNPRSDDIEERVKQMLDPSIPDVPDLGEVTADDTQEKPDKIVVIKSSSTPAKNIKVSDTPSAPELPGSDSQKIAPKTSENIAQPPSAKSSKKVIIPISHDGAAVEAEVPEPVENIPTSQLAKDKNPPKPLNKITVESSDDTPEGVAEKLDEAIAELGSTGANDTEKLDEISSESEVADSTLATQDQSDEIAIDDPEVITDPQTDKVVADIIANESDEILEIEDAVRDTDKPVAVKKPRKKFFKALGSLLRKPAFRWALVFLVLGGSAAIAAVPTARYLVLNTAGVRASSSLTVVDDSTNQPLKNAEVRLGDIVGTTDQEGKVTLNKVRLGNSVLTINKRAFAPLAKTVVMGWGSNPLGSLSLVPTGTQYTIVATDFLSGAALANVAASSGAADAKSDAKGVIKLTIEKPTDKEFTIDLKLDGYRDEKLTINPDDTSEHAATLVPAKKHTYVSKRSGKYDIYSAYIDGKDEKVVLAGSGNERDDMVLVPHPKDNVAAYASTRPGQLSSTGTLLTNLLLVNLDSNETTNIGSSEEIKIVSWSNDRLVYVQIAAGSSVESPDRYRLMSYNYKDASSKELAKSNFFNDVIGIGGIVYYAPSSAYQTAATNFYRINVDGTNNEIIHDKEVWNIIRTNYDHMALSVQQEWYDYRVGDKQPAKLNAAPADQVSRTYIDSPDGKHAVWVDNRDGKGVLLSYDIAAKTDKTIRSESGIGYPARWLNDSTIIYRVKNTQETADYAISIHGGEPVKISDVTNSTGLTSWLY